MFRLHHRSSKIFLALDHTHLNLHLLPRRCSTELWASILWNNNVVGLFVVATFASISDCFLASRTFPPRDWVITRYTCGLNVEHKLLLNKIWKGLIGIHSWPLSAPSKTISCRSGLVRSAFAIQDHQYRRARLAWA